MKCPDCGFVFTEHVGKMTYCLGCKKLCTPILDEEKETDGNEEIS